MSAPSYRILFVCTGNICRSPFMERLLRARLDASLPDAARRIELGSAGTWAVVGESMTPEATSLLLQYGGDPGGFVARDLDESLIDAADLILTATREHRAQVVTMAPRAAAKTATLREFTRLLDGITPRQIAEVGDDPTVRLRAIASIAFAQRGMVPAVEPSEDDIPDPYGGPMAGYQLAADLIEHALAMPLGLLTG